MKSTNNNNNNNNSNPTQLLPDWLPSHNMYDSNSCVGK